MWLDWSSFFTLEWCWKANRLSMDSKFLSEASPRLRDPRMMSSPSLYLKSSSGMVLRPCSCASLEVGSRFSCVWVHVCARHAGIKDLFYVEPVGEHNGYVIIGILHVWFLSFHFFFLHCGLPPLSLLPLWSPPPSFYHTFLLSATLWNRGMIAEWLTLLSSHP